MQQQLTLPRHARKIRGDPDTELDPELSVVLHGYAKPGPKKHTENRGPTRPHQVVSAKDIFVSKPPLRYVFPAPTGVTEYEGHVGSMS